MNTDESGINRKGWPEGLAALALKAIGVAADKYRLSSEQGRLLADEAPRIFDFFDNLMQEASLKPAFRLRLLEQSFEIEALSGECPAIDAARLVKPYYHQIDLESEAAASLNGPSPPSEAVKLQLHDFLGQTTLRQAFATISPAWHHLGLTKAQIRCFCVKHPNLITEDSGRLVFCLMNSEAERAELGLAVVASLNRGGLHISLRALDQLISSENEHRYYLVTLEQSRDRSEEA